MFMAYFRTCCEFRLQKEKEEEEQHTHTHAPPSWHIGTIRFLFVLVFASPNHATEPTHTHTS